MQNSNEFLDAFNTIDQHLRRQNKIGRNESFYAAVEKAADSNAGVRNMANDLKEFADLRNAIVHERTDGHVIAEPNDKAVYEIQQLAKVLTSPPKALNSAARNVFILKPNESVAEAVTAMLRESFSQIPIYDDNVVFIGLLTSNTIARWLGSLVQDDIFSVSETRIEDVLKYTEYEEHCTFLSRQADVHEAIERFSRLEQQGKRLEAILVTESGQPNKRPIGIITLYDLPRMLEGIDYRLNG